MRRIIREVQPRWVVGENVLGLVNWNGGLVFEEVQADLEAEGYEVQPYVLPAASVGNCPHKRDRVWFVAYSKSAGNRKLKTANKGKQNRFNNNNGKNGPAPDTKEQGLQGGEVNGSTGELREESHKLATRFVQPNWEKFPTQSPLCSRTNGISTELDSITFSKWRNESIKAAGNAIVPQVVFQIFKAINEYREKYP
jgi:DNA (cytosine-5)-methyltransferase 1